MKWRDWQLWAAHGAALIFWLVWYFYTEPVFHPAWPRVQPLPFAMLVVVYPLLEETVFRGLLQPAIANRLPRRWRLLSAANLLTSGIFASLHLFYKPPGWALLTFFPSLVFGYFRERHNSLITPI